MLHTYSDIRLWQVRFQVLRPIASLPAPYELVLERQTARNYYHAGPGRPLDQAQIVCTISGAGAFRCRGTEHKLTAGKAFMSVLGDPDTAYYYPSYASDPWVFLWMSFIGESAAAMVRDMNRQYGYVFDLSLESQLIRYLQSFYPQRGAIRFVTPTEGASIVHDALSALGETIEKPLLLSRKSELVRAAQTLITTHLDRSLNLSEVAGELQVSREHLSRVFSQETGMTPGAFAARERMLLAQRLLQDRTLNCKEIAERIGFDSPSGFARAFRAVFGVPPSQYRK